MQKNKFFLLEKLKNTASAQLWPSACGLQEGMSAMLPRCTGCIFEQTRASAKFSA